MHIRLMLFAAILSRPALSSAGDVPKAEKGTIYYAIAKVGNSAVGYTRYVMKKKDWKVFVQEGYLEKNLKQKFDSTDHTVGSISPGYCGYLYRREKKDGTIRYSLASLFKSRAEAAEAQREKKKFNPKYEFWDVECSE